MQITQELLSEINVENIYQHILNLHYERSPLFSPQNLKQAKDYICTCFKNSSLHPETNNFQLHGSSEEYTNISAKLHPNSSPELLITSHYDHLQGSPGADDNLSAVAIMLELARILSEHQIELPIEFVSFDLEEQNPVITKKSFQKGLELGLYDEKRLPQTQHFHQMRNKFLILYLKTRSSGHPLKDVPSQVFAEIEPELTPLEKEYFQHECQLLTDPQARNWVDFLGLNGSSHYVQQVIKTPHTLQGVINLETCGYTSQQPHSQRFPIGINPEYFHQYDIDDPNIGTFIAIVSDEVSSTLGAAFFEACQHPIIQLPAMHVNVPLTFEQILQTMLDLLRSDHAPFWKARIPALMITDTANFRNPFYHTPGDIITTLDFDFILKVAQATLWTASTFF